MYQQEVTITATYGLHMRPAAQLVKAAKKFSSQISIVYNNNTVNAKSLLKLQTIGLIKGATINIIAEGKDEQEAVQYLIKLITKLK